MTISGTLRNALVCCIALCGLMLGGCHSSRSSVKGSQGKVSRNDRRGAETAKPATPGNPISVSDIDDPMARDLISEANRWLGTPYNYGGDSHDGTDCSGLVMSVYRDVTGVKIPRTTREQIRYCTNVARNNIRPGDLVFFANGQEVSHVGLYVGNGSMIHASSSRGVVISDIDSGYWGRRYLSGGRVEPARESWASLNRGKRGKSKPSKGEPAPAAPVTPAESPARLLYDHGEMAAATTAPSSTSSVPVSELGSILAASSQAPSTSSQTAPRDAEPVSEIDLLDLIITQKTDSIFSSQYLD